MAVTPLEVATALGRDEPEPGSLEYGQWSMWITDALMLIEARLGDPTQLDQGRLDYVVREAVVAQVRRPDDATSVEVAVDDGRVARRYSSGRGRVYIRDEWWDLLDPSGAAKGAFDIDTNPTHGLQHSPFCSLRFGGEVCSCGAVLSRFMPIYE